MWKKNLKKLNIIGIFGFGASLIDVVNGSFTVILVLKPRPTLIGGMLTNYQPEAEVTLAGDLNNYHLTTKTGLKAFRLPIYAFDEAKSKLNEPNLNASDIQSVMRVNNADKEGTVATSEISAISSVEEVLHLMVGSKMVGEQVNLDITDWKAPFPKRCMPTGIVVKLRNDELRLEIASVKNYELCEILELGTNMKFILDGLYILLAAAPPILRRSYIDAQLANPDPGNSSRVFPEGTVETTPTTVKPNGGGCIMA